MTKSAPDYYSSVSIAGRYGTEMKPVLVDVNGQMYIAMTGQEITIENQLTDYFQAGQNIGNITGSDLPISVDQENSDRVIQGAVEGNFPVVALDANGIILSRMKGAAGGDLILNIFDDCGDTSDISDWGEGVDALIPVDETILVKQGNHSMLLGIDADKNVGENASWINDAVQGDFSEYQHDWVYFWVYLGNLDYLISAGPALYYRLGSDSANYVAFSLTKSDLSIGWNLIKCDLDNPSSLVGNPDWLNVDYQRFIIYELAGNTHDFSIIIDSIMFVRPTPGAGTLKDIAVDENGIMLSKMTGQYGNILRPLAVDENGLMLAKMTGLFNSTLKTIAVDTDGIMKANLAVQSLPSMQVRPFYTETKWETASTHLDPNETDTILTINGSGILLGGIFYTTCADYHDTAAWYIDIDAVRICQISLVNLQDYDITEPRGIPLYIMRDVPADDKFYLGIQPGLTFETSCVFSAHNPLGDVGDDYGVLIWYALTP